ncbi:MAG: HAMP domain-containing histidine kinase [Chloroflexia bacterium]|nr:HAMP domain-containing histidine kinase [Chloroflexia bacterium]
MVQSLLQQMQDIEGELTGFIDRLEPFLEQVNKKGRSAAREQRPEDLVDELRVAYHFTTRLLPLLRAAYGDFSEMNRERKQLLTLFEVSQLINSTLQLADLLEIVMDRTIAVTGAERGFLMLRDEASGQLHFAVARNMRRQDLEEESFQVSWSVVNRVAEATEPVLTDNASEDPRFADSVSIATYVLRSILCVPLLVKNRCIGVLYVDNRVRIGHFTPDDLDLLTAFANQAAVAIENARLFEHIVVLDRLKGDFLESVSHELRSPLTSLNAGLELLAQVVSEDDHSLWELVNESGQRLTRIVQRLTRFSEIEEDGRTWIGTEDLAEMVPLRELLAEAIEPHRAKSEEKKLVLNLVIEGEIVSLQAPRGLLRALNEVLTNAVAYTEKGVIFVTARRSGNEVLISVADTGIGIPSDEMPYIFDKLFRGRKVRALAKTQGLGLGLSVARWTILSLGGRIWAESVEGKGSVFTVALPLQQAEGGGWQVRIPEQPREAAGGAM